MVCSCKVCFICYLRHPPTLRYRQALLVQHDKTVEADEHGKMTTAARPRWSDHMCKRRERDGRGQSESSLHLGTEDARSRSKQPRSPASPAARRPSRWEPTLSFSDDPPRPPRGVPPSPSAPFREHPRGDPLRRGLRPSRAHCHSCCRRGVAWLQPRRHKAGTNGARPLVILHLRSTVCQLLRPSLRVGHERATAKVESDVSGIYPSAVL